MDTDSLYLALAEANLKNCILPEKKAKYRRVPHEAVNLKSTNRGYKTSNDLVGTYNQTKKGLRFFLHEKGST